MASKRVLYSTPSQAFIDDSQFERFRLFLASRGLKFASYWEVHQWSTTTPDAYWSAAWDFLSIIGERSATQVRPNRDLPAVYPAFLIPF